MFRFRWIWSFSAGFSFLEMILLLRIQIGPVITHKVMQSTVYHFFFLFLTLKPKTLWGIPNEHSERGKAKKNIGAIILYLLSICSRHILAMWTFFKQTSSANRHLPLKFMVHITHSGYQFSHMCDPHLHSPGHYEKPWLTTVETQVQAHCILLLKLAQA